MRAPGSETREMPGDGEANERGGGSRPFDFGSAVSDMARQEELQLMQNQGCTSHEHGDRGGSRGGEDGKCGARRLAGPALEPDPKGGNGSTYQQAGAGDGSKYSRIAFRGHVEPLCHSQICASRAANPIGVFANVSIHPRLFGAVTLSYPNRCRHISINRYVHHQTCRHPKPPTSSIGQFPSY